MKMLVRDKKFYRDFFTMTMTIALQNLIVYGVNLADIIALSNKLIQNPTAKTRFIGSV